MKTEVQTNWSKRLIIFIVSGVILLLPLIIDAPEGLSQTGFRSLAVFAVCILWWVTNVIPLMITSLFAIVAFPLFNIADAHEVYPKFGNTAVFFLLGSFILASAFMRSGLSTRISLIFIKTVGKSPLKMVIAFQLLATFLAFWTTGHTVVAILIPILLELGNSLSDEQNGVELAKSLSLAVMWGAVIGSNATFLGGARAPLAVAILSESTGRTITFSQWLIATLPLVIVMTLVGALILLKITPKKVDIKQSRTHLAKKVKNLGPTSRREKLIAGIMLLTIIAWFVFGNRAGLANIALIAVITLFFLKLTSWKEVEEDVNWGIILMYGGAIALGSTLSETGVSDWIMTMTGGLITSSIAFLVIIATLSIFFTETMSNSAVVAFMMPMAVATAIGLNASPEILALSITIPSGFAFMLPMSTPAVAMTLSTGYVEMKDTIKNGIILNITGLALTFMAIVFYWPIMFGG
jgi:sodium-dependent dicarboxylate transporter 2/3/5